MADAKRLSVGLPFPAPTSQAFSNYALDANNDAIGFIFSAPQAMTITRLGVRIATVTGTSPTYRISLQGVSATTGAPDGTVRGGGSPASVTFQPTASQNGTFQWYTLTNAYTCVRGELLAVVVDYSTGTVNASNNTSFGSYLSNATPRLIPYSSHNVAGTWSKQLNGLALFAYGSASAAFGVPVQASYSATINSGTTPDEIATRFTLPAEWGSTFQVVGARFMSVPTAGHTIRMQLYEGTTVLQNVTLDTDQMSFGSVARMPDGFFDEATLSVLNFGTEYRVGVRPDSATNQIYYGVNVATAADGQAFELGENFTLSQRTDDGAWTDTDTTRPFFELILADWTEPQPGVGPGILRPVVAPAGIWRV